MSAWSAPALGLLKYIPAPNVSATQYSTSSFDETVRDDKASGRVDANSRWGQFFVYYFFDDSVDWTTLIRANNREAQVSQDSTL